MSTPNPDGSLTLSAQERTNLIEWLSEMLDPLSYEGLPDPNPIGIAIRLRGQSIKHIMLADPPPPPPAPTPSPSIMYDSVTAADIPDGMIVAGYVDGLYAWKGDPNAGTGDWARFPHHATITVFGGGIADIIDCETGDVTPDQAASWIVNYPGNCVYTPLSEVPAVKAAMISAGQPWRLFTAHWTGQAHLCNKACLVASGLPLDTLDHVQLTATQYANPDSSGGHFDKSLLTQDFLDAFIN